jgi:hypothetical protein
MGREGVGGGEGGETEGGDGDGVVPARGSGRFGGGGGRSTRRRNGVGEGSCTVRVTEETRG